MCVMGMRSRYVGFYTTGQMSSVAIVYIKIKDTLFGAIVEQFSKTFSFYENTNVSLMNCILYTNTQNNLALVEKFSER